MSLQNHIKNNGINSPKIVFIMGGPGSGKGTFGPLIASRYRLKHLSAGDLLREEVNRGTEKGKQFHHLIKRGDLVPAQDLLQLIIEQMARHENKCTGFIIDGYPRDLQQAKIFESTIGPPECVIYLHCYDQTLIQRLMQTNRGRDDDTLDVIQRRIQTFHKNTFPLIDYYKDCCFKVRNEFLSIEHIFSEICNLLDPHLIL